MPDYGAIIERAQEEISEAKRYLGKARGLISGTDDLEKLAGPVGGLLNAAAQLLVWKRVKDLAELDHARNVVPQKLAERVIRMAAYSENSTSPLANISRRLELEQWARALDSLGLVAGERVETRFRDEGAAVDDAERFKKIIDSEA